MEVKPVKNSLEVNMEEVIKDYDEVYEKMMETADKLINDNNTEHEYNPLVMIYNYMKLYSEQQAKNMLKYLLREYPGLQKMRPEVQVPLINIAISKLLYKKKRENDKFNIMPVLKYLPMDVTVEEWLVNLRKYTIPLLVNNEIFDYVDKEEK